METTRILWSGLTGRTGREAIEIARTRNDIEIVSGISRTMMKNVARIGDVSLEGIKWFQYHELGFPFNRLRDVDVIVDFSRPQQLGTVITLAVMLNKPLIIGTSGLTDLQLADLRHYCYAIPIFRGGNFRFEVKRFIDEAVNIAQSFGGDIDLYEEFYTGKRIPSETSKVMQRRIFEATGKMVRVHSSATLPKERLPCNWRISWGLGSQNNLCCSTLGFGDLAHDVLEIAKVMAKKPTRQEGFYDLDEIWNDLPH